MKFILLIINAGLILLFATVESAGQSLKDLQKQKESTAAEIEYIDSLLKETNTNAKSSLNRLAILEKQIRLQGQLIENMNVEIDFLDQAIYLSSHKVDSLSAELQAVKNKYASMIRYAKRNQNSNNQLFFLLSSDDFNQAYKRFTYLRQYADYRRKQAERIVEVKNSLNRQIIDFNNRKEEKQNLLASKIKQTKRIEKQKAQQKEYYSELQQKEKDLRKKLDNQRKIEASLQKAIERAIAEEAKKAGRKSPAGPGMVLTNEEKALSADFSDNKGRFPWPVRQGVITDRFGEHPHPVLKYVMVRNAGIDITTQSNEKARAIFKGEVSKVVAISGGNLAVIVRHGNYLTVYSNLSEVYVKAGQKIDIKQEIGRIFTDKDDDNKTVLKFQLWRESIKLDPEEWIQRQ
jgi:murein hydrolase activator